jgi:hypothetical protein
MGFREAGPVSTIVVLGFFADNELSEPICGPLHPYILKEFRETYHFDPAKRPKPVRSIYNYKQEFS